MCCDWVRRVRRQDLDTAASKAQDSSARTQYILAVSIQSMPPGAGRGILPVAAGGHLVSVLTWVNLTRPLSLGIEVYLRGSGDLACSPPQQRGNQLQRL